MGLQKREEGQGGFVFADIKGNVGAIVVKTGEAAEGGGKLTESYDSVTGVVTDLDIKENDYKGETITNLRVKLEDGQSKPIIASVALGSFFSAKLVGLLNAADLSKPLTIAVGMMKVGETVGGKPVNKDTAWITVRQGADNARLAPLYTDGKTALPEAAKVVVSGKTMTDMTPVNNEVGAVIQGLFAKMDALHEQATTHDEDTGVNAAEAAAAAAAAEASARRPAMSARA